MFIPFITVFTPMAYTNSYQTIAHSNLAPSFIVDLVHGDGLKQPT